MTGRSAGRRRRHPTGCSMVSMRHRARRATGARGNRGHHLGKLRGRVLVAARRRKRRSGFRRGPVHAGARWPARSAQESERPGAHRDCPGRGAGQADGRNSATDRRCGRSLPPAGMGGAAVSVAFAHRAAAPRYRIILPLSAEVRPDLPAVEMVAERLGLAGVLDRSKVRRGIRFLFAEHAVRGGRGAVRDADDRRRPGHRPNGSPKPARRSWRHRRPRTQRIAAAAHAEAARRREARRLRQGSTPIDSLIEKLRSRFDLASVLASHGYDRQGQNWRHPNSSCGCFGANIRDIWRHRAGLSATTRPILCMPAICRTGAVA